MPMAPSEHVISASASGAASSPNPAVCAPPQTKKSGILMAQDAVMARSSGTHAPTSLPQRGGRVT